MIISFIFQLLLHKLFFYFFFNDTATTEIYTLSLHDALPISSVRKTLPMLAASMRMSMKAGPRGTIGAALLCWRSEEHTSELQSRSDLVCRLLLEKKKKHSERYYMQGDV